MRLAGQHLKEDHAEDHSLLAIQCLWLPDTRHKL